MKSLFLLVPIGVLLGSAYVLWHVWHQLPLPFWMRVAVLVLMSASIGCLFVSLSEPPAFGMELMVTIYKTGTSSLIILLYLILLYFLLDVLQLFRVLPASFLRTSWPGSLTVLILISGLLFYGNWHYHHKHVEHITLPTDKKLSRTLRIVLMSDLHLGYHIRRNELHDWVNRINQEKPDYILIAGDLIDRSVRPLEHEKMYEEFHRFEAPVYACPGNHEYITGYKAAADFLQKAGVHLLRDQVIEVEKGLCFVGRDDCTNTRRASLSSLMQEREKSDFFLLLDHQPFHLEQAEKKGIDFQISGHTHHGQVFPVNLLTDLLYDCAYGPVKKGKSLSYITSGIGIWGGKFRIGTCSEYLVLDVIPKK